MNAGRCFACDSGPVLPAEGYDEDRDTFETAAVCQSCGRPQGQEPITVEWVRRRKALLAERAS